MTARFFLGECMGSTPAFCFVMDTVRPHFPAYSVFGFDQAEAEANARHLVGLLNSSVRITVASSPEICRDAVAGDA